MRNELVTVIIPIYNVENYLDRCIQSVLSQTYVNIEIILVDDGSTDSCPQKCDEYAKKYLNIIVVHKKNGGLAEARNFGINAAKGTYITFVDSDDFISNYYIENLYNAIKKTDADLAISMFESLQEGEEVRSVATNNIDDSLRVYNDEQCLKELLLQKGIETSAPGKMYKSSLINELRFPVGKLYEDIMFTSTMISRAKKIAIINNVDYYYYQRNGSIQYQKFTEAKMDCIIHSKQLIQFIKDKYPSLEKAVYSRYFAALCNIIFQIPDGQFPEYKDSLWKEIKQYRKDVLLNSEVRVKTRVAAILSYSGLDIMKFIYKRTQIRGKYL